MPINKRLPLLRVSSRVVSFMEGTGWWQSGEWDRTPAGDALAASVKELLYSSRTNSDGSSSVRVTPDQAAFIRRQAVYLADAAQGDSGWDADARADLNSARALKRHIDAL